MIWFRHLLKLINLGNFKQMLWPYISINKSVQIDISYTSISIYQTQYIDISNVSINISLLSLLTGWCATVLSSCHILNLLPLNVSSNTGKTKSPVVPDPDYMVDAKDRGEFADKEGLHFRGSVRVRIMLVENPPVVQIFLFAPNVII